MIARTEDDMSILVLLSAACVVFGVLLLVWEALGRRPLSQPRQSATRTSTTLEPKGQGLRFLGPYRNWAGLALIAAGIVMFIINS